MDKLIKKIICEFIIIFACMFSISIYIAGLIALNIYFSNFLLTTIQVIFAGVILIFMLPLYFHDLKMADEKYEKEKISKVNKRFWSYCVIVSGIISIISILSYFILCVLVFLNIINIKSPVLDMITLIIMITVMVSIVIFFTIIIVRDVIKHD